MVNKKRRRAAPGSAHKRTRKPAPPQAADNAALENIAHLWKRTEEALQNPLTHDEQAAVAKVRSLLFTLAQDIGGQQHPPLTDAQTARFRHELDALFQRPPFASGEQPVERNKP